MSDFLYFDHHRVSQPFPEVMEKYFRFSKEYWASWDAPYFLGAQQLYPLQKSLDRIFLEIGAEEQDEVFWTASQEETLFQVFFSVYLQIARESGKTLFLTSVMEESPVYSLLQGLEGLGCSFKTLAVNSKGQLTPETLRQAITSRTALVSLSWACGLTGVLHPLADLVEVCQEKGVLLHVDASYVLGKSFFRFQDMHIDFLTLDGSLFHGMRGVHATFIRKKALLQPFPIQGSFFRKGCENMAMIASFAEALGRMQDKFEQYCMEIARLRDRFEEGLCIEYPEAVILFKNADRLPCSSVIAFPPLSSEALLFLCNTKGIYASCGGGKFQSLAQVLLHCGVETTLANSALSFSFSYDTTDSDIDAAIRGVGECANKLRVYAGDLHA